MEAFVNDDQLVETETISYMDTVVYKAAFEGDFDALNKPQYISNLGVLLTPNKNTILHIFVTGQTKLTNEIQRDSEYQFLKQILNKCPSLLTQANIKGETPLHFAARYGHDVIVSILLDRDPAKSQQEDIESTVTERERLIMIKSMRKDTALHEAVRGGHLRVVQILIKEDPDLLNLANDADETPLYLAAERGFGDIVTEVLKTCSSVAAYNGPIGRTALHAAVQNRDKEMAKEILEKERTLTKKTDQQGWTPLHLASYLHVRPIVKLLLRSDKSAAYLRDIDGRTPLLSAAARRCRAPIKIQIEVMEIIMSHCPDCCEIVDRKGRNVLHLVVESFAIKRIRALLGNPVLYNLVNQKDDEGNTPLHLLAEVGFSCQDLVRHPLLDKNAVNNENLTAVDIIYRNDYEDLKMKLPLLQSMLKAGHRKGGRNKMNEEPSSKMMERVDNMISEYKKATDSHLIAATLIATVTFAAGLTLPGGYNNNAGADQGIALLSRKASFRAFLITDAIALMLSISVVFIHLFLAMEGDKRIFYKYFMLAFDLRNTALVSMVLAFATGTYAVLPHSSAFGIVICAFTGCLFIFFYLLFPFSYTIGQLRSNDMLVLENYWNAGMSQKKRKAWQACIRFRLFDGGN